MGYAGNKPGKKNSAHKKSRVHPTKNSAHKKSRPHPDGDTKAKLQKIITKKSQQPTALRGTATVPPEQLERRSVGRAIVLAHGAGGSSSHSSMKAWRQRLEVFCDEVLPVDFPRPYQTSTQTAALVAAVRQARKAGHKRVVLAGVGLGARVALLLLSGAPGDDAQSAEPMPPKLLKAVVGVVALALPLRKRGEGEVRDAPMRALPADAPPLLLVNGTNDPHVDALAIEAARGGCAARTEVHMMEGGDGALRVASGTHLEKEATTALEAALGAFLDGTLGSAADASREVWVSANSRSSSGSPLASDAATSLEERQRANWLQQQEERRQGREERREAEERERAAASAAAAAMRAGAATDGTHSAHAKEAALDSAAASSASASAGAVAPHEIELRGCGEAAVNGRYRVDGVRDGVPSYRQVAPEGASTATPSFTIERDAAPGQATQWCLCVDYGWQTYCFVDAETDLPPCDGWSCGEPCRDPPPTLSAVDPADAKLPTVDDGDAAAPPLTIDEAAKPTGPPAASKYGLSRHRRHRQPGMKLSRGAVKKMRSQGKTK